MPSKQERKLKQKCTENIDCEDSRAFSVRSGDWTLVFGIILVLLGLASGFELSNLHLGVKECLQKGVSRVEID